MPITHKWDGTILTITSDSGTSAADLKGEKGDTGARGQTGLTGARGGGAQIEDGVISAETCWSSAGIMDRFAEAMGYETNPVVCNPMPQMPLHIITDVEATQAGTGTASTSNIRPIAAYDAVSVVRCGKNLIHTLPTGQTINGITYTVNSDGSITASGTATATSILQYPNFYLPKGKYILTGCPTGGSQNNYSLRCLDTNSTILGDDIGSGYTINIETENNILVAILIRSGVSINKTFKPMLQEVSITDRTYEAFKGETYTFTLDNTLYGGSIDWNTGEITVYYDGFTFTGAEDWKHVSDGEFKYYYLVVGENGCVVNSKEDICSHWIQKEITSTNTNIGFTVYNSSAAKQARIAIRHGISEITTIAEWKAYLAAQYAAGTPVQVKYKIRTPYIIRQTPQVIKGIEGTNTIYTEASGLTVFGRVDTMYQLSQLAARVAALEAAKGGN